MTRSLTRRRFLAGSAAAATATAATGPAAGAPSDAQTRATGPPDVPADATVQAEGPPDPDELAALVADLVAASVEDHDVPGGTAALVVDGEVALTEGYGVADRESGATVDPAETPFRVGSVSKPVVATALMSRVQAGDIDPEEPVSAYLDVGLADSYPDPTLTDLITHRSGFEVSNRGLWITDADDLRPLPEALRSNTPARVRPPGEASAYSNYGYALAGGVLASVAGEPFPDAVESDLLGPAGMERSSFRQPLPASLADAHATGHTVGTTYRDGEFPYVGLAPAGALSTTAEDMARFLQVHLNDGVVDGERVLAPETVDACHRQWGTNHEALPGMAFGFVETFHGDTRVLRHDGATPAFYSDLLVIPELGVGLFLAYNGSSGSSAARDVIEGVRSELLPDPEEQSLSPDGTPTRAEELTGTYRSLRRSWAWHDRVTTTLQAPTVEVSVADDGALVTSDGSTTRRWVEVEPLVFERVDGQQRLAFGEAEGTVEYLFLGGSPTAAFGRVGGIDRASLHAVLALVSTLALLSAVFGWPAASAVRWLRSSGDADVAVDPRRWSGRPATLGRTVAVGSSLAVFGFLLLALVHLALAPYAVLSAPPLTFTALFALPILGAFGTVAALGFAVRSWREGYWGLLGRVHYTLVAASLVAVCWLLWYWNLLVPPL